MENTSGQGCNAIVPEEIRGWNWGAFLMNWIWAIGNNSYIGLISILPYVGIIMWIVLGIKGNEWAWQNRRWESVEQFKHVQKLWAYWGIVITLAVIVLYVSLIKLIESVLHITIL